MFFVVVTIKVNRYYLHAFDPAGSNALFYGICPSRILPAGPATYTVPWRKNFAAFNNKYNYRSIIKCTICTKYHLNLSSKLTLQIRL
jgi:hypothetical protein